MKEFTEDIESRMGKAFRSKAGKKYGLSDVEIAMRQARAPSILDKLKDSMKEVDKRASGYLNHMNLNSKFIRKHLAYDKY
jgi:hypothetical protein